MTLREIERWKLRANALDRASTACVTIGVLAPISAAIYAPPGALTAPLPLALSVTAWLLAALILHFVADRMLRRIDA